MAGLTADECIYLESDATYRSIKPKRKDATPYTPKPQVAKLSRTLSNHATDPGVIVRCSRCIRTARGCSHERPCQPCRENGLSEWECRYTSASSFKVRGPGTRDLRKVKSLDKIPVTLAADPAALVVADDDDDEDCLTRPPQKQARSLSTNAVKDKHVQLLGDRTPRDYRTPSPPTNVSPISEPPGWKEAIRPGSATEDETTPRTSVPIPGTRHKFTLTADTDSSTISHNHGTTVIPAGSVEPPPMMTLIPTISQQSHANTIPESSPIVYTDDYQSSPSPYNSPPFQSSPPIHFHTIGGIQRLPPYAGTESSVSMFPPQASYRTPVGYSSAAGTAGHFVVPQTQHGFLVPQQGQGQLQPYVSYSQSPPYPRHAQPSQQPFVVQGNPAFYQQAQPQTQMPRHRSVPAAGPRHSGTSKQYVGSPQLQARLPINETQQRAQAIPVRGAGQPQHLDYYTEYGISPSEGTTPPTAYYNEHKNGVSRAIQSPARPSGSRDHMIRQEPRQQDGQDFDHGMYEQEMAWQDNGFGTSGQDSNV